jgi:hypothetical protein
MDIRLHFVCDANQIGEVKIYTVPSSEMLANIFTKPIANPRFEKTVSVVMRYLVEQYLYP